MSFLATFTRHIGHYRPLNFYIECSLGNGKGGQIPNLHKNRRQNILNFFTVFGKTAEYFFSYFVAIFLLFLENAGKTFLTFFLLFLK